MRRDAYFVFFGPSTLYTMGPTAIGSITMSPMVQPNRFSCRESKSAMNQAKT